MYYSELLESFTDYTHFTHGSKDGDKTATSFICQSFEFSKRLPDKASIFELLSKWNSPTVQTIMRFLVFLHTVHKTVIFCWLPSHMGISGNERADSAAKAALQKDASDYLISYNINTYAICGNANGTRHKFHATKPLIGEQPSAYRSVRRDEPVYLD